MQLSEIIKKAHANACEKGFYDCPECGGTGEITVKEEDYDTCPSCGAKGRGKDQNKNIGEMTMLCVTELGEAVNAHRSEKFANIESLNYLIHSGVLSFEKAFETEVKDFFEDEIADTIIRLADMCGYLGIEISDEAVRNDRYGYDLSTNTAEALLQLCGKLYEMYVGAEFYDIYNPHLRIEILSKIFWYLYAFCDHRMIDIDTHIELKMKYNASREYKHGKRY
jgi:NTP pyrophosphatase (non-canonical NTP hydrolase)